jgi:FkbM family methyltransferase
MSILDKIHLNDFGELIIEITNDGIFSTKNNSSVNYEFYIVIKSLDSNLTSHLMYHHCPIGYDLWTYNNNIFYINEENHPGICIEIYDKTNKELIFSKNYHNSKKYRCLELESKRFDVTYPSYHTFFNDTYFLQNFKIKDDDVVYDLGANIGAFSIACSNYNVKKIYAFEPHPEIYGCLNYNLNRYGKNCTTFNNAISDDFKTVRFGSSDSTVASSIKDDGAFEVESINLEKFVYKNNLDFPTYLKLDIEGAEYDFFENTSDEFIKNVHSIFFEFHNNNGSNLSKIINRLVNLGYKINHTENALDYNMSHMNTVYFNK